MRQATLIHYAANSVLHAPSPPAGEGRGGGSAGDVACGTPTPDPSPQGGGEKIGAPS